MVKTKQQIDMATEAIALYVDKFSNTAPGCATDRATAATKVALLLQSIKHEVLQLAIIGMSKEQIDNCVLAAHIGRAPVRMKKHLHDIANIKDLPDNIRFHRNTFSQRTTIKNKR